MNKVILIGRLTRNPDVRYSQEGKAVAKWTLAVDRRFKKEGEDSADFISCTAFGKTAEFMEKFVQQGMKIATVGEIRTGSYTNKDGNKVYTTDVIVETVEFCEAKLKEPTKVQEAQLIQSETPFQSAPQPVQSEIQRDANGFYSIDSLSDEGLPFN